MLKTAIGTNNACITINSLKVENLITKNNKGQSITLLSLDYTKYNHTWDGANAYTYKQMHTSLTPRI